MKKFILILATALIACSDERNERTLNEAEEVVDCCPDSTILNRIMPEAGNLTKRQKMRYLLLRTIAMDKCNIRLDTVLYMDEVAEYYNKKTTDITA